MRARVALGPVAALLFMPPAEAAPQTHVVTIDKMKFVSVPASVKRGDSIVWVNKDLFRHTATAANGAFDVDLQPGAKAKTVVARPGAIAFRCKYHPGMRSVLKVVP